MALRRGARAHRGDHALARRRAGSCGRAMAATTRRGGDDAGLRGDDGGRDAGPLRARAAAARRPAADLPHVPLIVPGFETRSRRRTTCVEESSWAGELTRALRLLARSPRACGRSAAWQTCPRARDASRRQHALPARVKVVNLGGGRACRLGGCSRRRTSTTASATAAVSLSSGEKIALKAEPRAVRRAAAGAGGGRARRRPGGRARAARCAVRRGGDLRACSTACRPTSPTTTAAPHCTRRAPTATSAASSGCSTRARRTWPATRATCRSTGRRSRATPPSSTCCSAASPASTCSRATTRGAR